MKLLVASVAAILCCLLAVACEAELDPSFNLEVGDCIEDAPVGEHESVKHVSCSAPGALRVLAAFDSSYEFWPGETLIGTEAESGCASSAGYSSSAGYYAPTKESWEQGGDREIVCLGEAQ
jgi:hypothetical protein